MYYCSLRVPGFVIIFSSSNSCCCAHGTRFFRISTGLLGSIVSIHPSLYRVVPDLFVSLYVLFSIRPYLYIRLFIVWYRIYSSLFTRYSDLVVRLLRPRPPTDTATPTLLRRWFDGIDS